jgi:hypothetical protein
MISLGVGDIQVMMDVLSSWGVHCLTKTTSDPRSPSPDSLLAIWLCWSIQFHRVTTTGASFNPSFSENNDIVWLYENDDLLKWLSRDPRMAGRYFLREGFIVVAF